MADQTPNGSGNTPGPREEFNEAAPMQGRDVTEDLARVQAEIDHLEANRQKPEKHLEYTIGGTIEKEVHSEEDRKNEAAVRAKHEERRALEKIDRRRYVVREPNQGPEQDDDPEPEPEV